MVKFKPCGESSLAHSSLFHKEPHAEPRAVGKADARFRQRVCPYPAVTLYIFCSSESEKGFLGDTLYNLSENRERIKIKDQKLLTYRRANVIKGKE